MADEQAARNGPCHGLKVIDFTTVVAGPMCGRILGDLGADVVKLESLEGDMLRAFPPIHRGLSAYFLQMNRNKRSIAIDLKVAQGRALAHKLAAEADIFIENLRPGVADRLGLGHAVLQATNQRLIYASISGVGDAGPYASQPTYDMVVQGLVGFMPVQGGQGEPQPIRSPVVDKVTAMSAAVAILAALNHRHATGQGQRLTTHMLDAWAAFILPERMSRYTFRNPDSSLPPEGNAYHVFRTRDGHAIGLVLQDSQFHGLCSMLVRADLASDGRFANPVLRATNFDELCEELGPAIAALSTAEFLEGARRHEVPFGPVNDIEGFFADAQALHNRSFFDVEDPDLGELRHLGFMAGFATSPIGAPTRAPRLGEHTDQILSELGYSAGEIERLRVAGCIR
jgi:crotonobetainyl-CoA:carnitine CoA-transferase CaiB-like acyl-CoA transferase